MVKVVKARQLRNFKIETQKQPRNLLFGIHKEDSSCRDQYVTSVQTEGAILLGGSWCCQEWNKKSEGNDRDKVAILYMGKSASCA